MHGKLVAAIRCDDVEKVGQLLRQGVDPRVGSPLLDAAVQGVVAVGELLVDAGADLEVRDAWNGTTPLLEAARFGAVDFIRFLCARGANRAAIDRDGRNARTLALLNNHVAADAALAELGVALQEEFRAEWEETQAAIRVASAEMAGKPGS